METIVQAIDRNFPATISTEDMQPFHDCAVPEKRMHGLSALKTWIKSKLPADVKVELVYLVGSIELAVHETPDIVHRRTAKVAS